MTLNFKELKLTDGTKLIAYFANNRGRGSNNVSLYVIPGNVGRKGNCRLQEKEEFIAYAQTSAWRGNVNLSMKVMDKLGITKELLNRSNKLNLKKGDFFS